MRHLLAVFLVAAMACGAWATTYYVSTSGNDGWPGTQSQPWATLQHAVATIANGDTILVMPGTYAGCRIEISGASGAPKTLAVQTSGTVLLNALGPVNRHNRILEIENYDAAVNYWVIDGLEVDGGNTIGGIDARSIDTQMNSNITIQNCVVHEAKNGTSVCTGIFSAFTNLALIQYNTSYSNAEHGCYTNNSCDDGVVRCNTFYSNASLGHHMNGDKSMGGDGQMTGWLIERNKSYSNGSNGFDGDGVSSSVWKNNLAYDNVSKGIHLTQVDGTSNPANDKFLNNTLVCPTTGFFPLNFIKGRSKVGGNNNTIKNNILYHYNTGSTMRGGLMYVSTWEPTLDSDYNLLNRVSLNDNKIKLTLAQWQAQYGQDLHSVPCTDPAVIWVSPDTKNFHLKPGSPAANSGTTLSEVTNDFDGESRPQGTAYDMGCFEDF